MTELTATEVGAPPDWALRMRHLMAVMDEAVPAFQERYCRVDGTLIWRQEWPGMDGSDDGYESFHNWPLLYSLGGASDLFERSRFLWDAVTRQFTAYGQVWQEFDAYYDWMHHGESNLYLYYFGLCHPGHPVEKARALRFARLYTDGINWDADKKLIRSPITGSKGPRFTNSWGDWQTHREVLDNYPPPFDDIEGVPCPRANWSDDEVYGKILPLLNQRMMTGDVPLNLTSTSLATHAFCYTGDDHYRAWVVDYLEAWAERIARNGGLCPDNVDENGVIGGRMDDKWWGGYYGWRWPHGVMSLLQPLVIAAMNATLLTGDLSYLDIPRSQLDRMVELGREENGILLIPHRHTDAGWTAYRPLAPEFPLQLAYFSMEQKDFDRLALFPERKTTWREVMPGRGKGDSIHIAPWHCYLQGDLPSYPTQILDAQYTEVARRLAVMENDDGDPETWDVHHWQEINPVHTEALLQLACGGPQVIYHGGLLHTRLRYFDTEQKRPGLPLDVAALVSKLTPESLTVTLSNTAPRHTRRVTLQAGQFGEHEFVGHGKQLTITLPPATQLTQTLAQKRFVHRPSYQHPFG